MYFMNTIRKLFIIALVILALGYVSPVHAEEIRSFVASYTIQKEGTVQAEERIQYDFGSAERHGIYRYIPKITENSEGKKYEMSVSDIRVTDELGSPYAFVTTSSGDQINIKIGDANKTVSGVHTYNIQYLLSGAITYFSDHDELYWNVTGNGWAVPIGSASATVSFPQAIPQSDIKMICYTGSAGSTGQNCTSGYLDGKAAMTASGLDEREGLTIAVSFPMGIVDILESTLVVERIPTLWEKILAAAIVIGITLAVLLWYIVLPIIIIIRWLRVGRDPKPTIGVASAWFEAPKTKLDRLLTPGETGTLLDETADMEDVTGTIVDLARRGYMKIVEKKKDDFTFIKEKEAGSDLQPFEKTFFDGIFSGGEEVRVKSKDLSGTVSKVKSDLYTAVVREKFFDKNPNTTRTIYYVIAGIAFFTGSIFLAIVAFFFGRAMPRKTLLGADAAAVAKSLKNFLTSQERWLAGIARDQLMFEKLLPYAVAFGVEKLWAKRFADIAMKDPEWFQGYGRHTFTSIYLANALASTHSSFSRAATPVSSTTGHSSGFSGGFSGGGGGGGGGGSW
jgi:uncharacterized membrane protein